jgi:hypothetical protein
VPARSRSRARYTALASLALVSGVLLAWSGPAAAHEETTTTAKTTTTTKSTMPGVKCPTPELLGDLRATGATVTTPGAEPRKLDKDQATAFMQTWLAYSVFNEPEQERPPARLPVSRLEVALIQEGQPTSLLIFYATDGTNAWVGAPAAPPAPPPNDQKWIRVPKPKQTMAAFAGRMVPICTGPTTPSTNANTATTVGKASKPSGTSSSGDGAMWALIVGGGVVVAGGAVVGTRVLRRRAD